MYRNVAMTVASDGTAYVVGYSWNAFSRDVALDPEGNVWVLTEGKGLNLYKNGEFVRVVN